MEILTLKKAQELKGKRIGYSVCGDPANGKYTGEVVVGDIISEWDYYKTQPCEGWESRTAEWESRMTDKQKDEKKIQCSCLMKMAIFSHISSKHTVESIHTLMKTPSPYLMLIDRYSLRCCNYQGGESSSLQKKLYYNYTIRL